MKDILLSVIIPVYNTEKYFKKCLDSVILAIKKANIIAEIIIINDGSNGNISEIIKAYLEDYKELIVYISQNNRGRGATRNVGLEKAKGKYINFVDSDDYIDENMYSKMLCKLKKDQADIVICDFENIDESYKEKSYRVEAKNLDIIDDKWGCFDVLMLPSCCNKLIKKDLFNGLKFPENINYEDLATIPIVVLKALKVSYLPEMLYKYVQNKDSVMHEEYGLSQLNLIDALEIVCNRIESLDISNEDINKAQYMLYTRRYYEELLEKIMLSNNRKELIKVFCVKIKKIENKFWSNNFFINLISSQGKKKLKGNILLHKAIQRNSYRLLNIYITKRFYYNFFAIRYMSIIRRNICG